MEKKIANISLTEALISTKPRNLKLAQKTTIERNLKLIIQTRVKIPELDKKIKQIKKIEGYNQEKNRRNTIIVEMTM
jgi:hypothetical protein